MYNIHHINNAARGQWPWVVQTLTGMDDSFFRNNHGPCPMCGGKDRYRFDDKDGSGSYLCGQCGAGYGMDLLINYAGMEFKAACDAVGRLLGLNQSDSSGYTKPRLTRSEIKQEKMVIALYESDIAGGRQPPDNDTARYFAAQKKLSPN